MNYAETIVRLTVANEFMRREEERREAKRKLAEAHRRAIADVCTSMAQCNMRTALLAPDTRVSAEAFAESLRWQGNAALASAGLPLIEKTP